MNYALKAKIFNKAFYQKLINLFFAFLKRRIYLLSLALAGLFSLFIILYSLYVPLPTPKNPLIFYFTEKRCDLKRTLITALKASKESIYLHTYALTDPEILSLLKKKGEEGVEIHLYYHKKASPELEALKLKNTVLYPYQGKGLMHRKIWIIDQQVIFLGSANLTPSSLKMHDNSMVGLYAPSLGRALTREAIEELELTVGNYQLHYFSLPSQKGLEAILELLESAQKSVSAALFTFTHPLLVNKFLKIHEKGIKVSLTLDGTTARGASKKAYETLVSGGIPVKTSQGLQLHHHKWACIDDKVWIIGSANWTKAAFNINKDFIIIIESN